jgi:hypothetical protein
VIYIAASLAAIASAVAMIRYPWLALLFAVSAPQLGLVVRMLSIDGTAVNTATWIGAALGVVGTVGSKLRRHMSGRAWVVVVSVLFVLGVGAVVGLANLHVVQFVQGFKILTLPILGAIIAQSLRLIDLLRLMRCLTVVVVASAFAAVVQQAIGPAALVASGLEAGTTVRTYDGLLRASGLAMTNYDLGSFAAVFTAISIVWWKKCEATSTGRTWVLIGVGAGVVLLFTSIYRTGFLLVFLSIGMWLVTARSLKPATRLAIGVLCLAGVYLFDAAGYGGTDSLQAREAVWSAILDDGTFPLFGNGVGSAGAASNSSFSDARVTTDNYFLNILVQFGAVGFLIILGIIRWAVVSLVMARADDLLHGGYVLAAAIACFWFVEFWEYSGAMMLSVAVAVACRSIRQDQRDRPPLAFSLSDTGGAGSRMPAVWASPRAFVRRVVKG